MHIDICIWRFQQDNDTKDTSKVCKERNMKTEIEALERPS